MPNETKYVDNVAGNNGNTGDSEAQAYADIATALSNITGGGNIIHVQATGTDYAITAALAIVNGDTTDGVNTISGYTTTPGARDGRPTITSSSSGVAIFSGSGADAFVFDHLKVTHTGASRGEFFDNSNTNSTSLRIIDCLIDGVLRVGYGNGRTGNWHIGRSVIRNCTADGIIIEGGGIIRLIDSIVSGCADNGIKMIQNGTVIVVNSHVYDNTTYGVIVGAVFRGATLSLVGSTVTGNGSDGVLHDSDSGYTFLLIENAFGSNGGYDVAARNAADVTDATSFLGFGNYYGSGGYASTSGARNGVPVCPFDGSITADPFVDAANGDFNINNTAGGGAVLRAASYDIPN